MPLAVVLHAERARHERGTAVGTLRMHDIQTVVIKLSRAAPEPQFVLLAVVVKPCQAGVPLEEPDGSNLVQVPFVVRDYGHGPASGLVRYAHIPFWCDHGIKLPGERCGAVEREVIQ